MGIALVENFDVDDMATLAAPRLTAPIPSGYSGYAGFNMSAGANLITTWGLRTFTEKGIRRTSLGVITRMTGGSSRNLVGGLLRIPLPPLPPGATNLSRSYYMSMRLRFLGGDGLAINADPVTALPMPFMNRIHVFLALSFNNQWTIDAQYKAFSITNGAYITGGNALKNRIFVGPYASPAPTTTQTEFSADADGWFHVEVYKPAGSMFYTVWVNDFMYVAALASPDANVVDHNTNWPGLVLGRTEVLNGTLYYGFEVTDLIVIDPTTAGQKYRFGSSGRVLSMDYTSDISNEWAANPAATLSHRQMMMIDKSVPGATNILTGTVIGQREQYGVQPIPADFGPHVPALLVRPRVANNGAAAHSVAAELDWGAGRTEVATKIVAAGGAYDTTPIIMTAKPNGTPWTAADFADAKIGFSVKS